MITFAVVGHNEAATLAHACAQATAAARDGDRVVFVDSASTDGSAQVAHDAGVRVLSAPLGKGNAMRLALRDAGTEWVCFVDADLIAAERNIAHVLAETVRSHPEADTVVGQFTDRDAGTVASNTWSIYEPLMAALCPEGAGRFGTRPLTGFRAVRPGLLFAPEAIPPTFGVEAHLNCVAAYNLHEVRVVDVGWYEGPFKYKPTMGLEIAAGVLDTAEFYGRLARDRRPAWDAWVAEGVAVVGSYRGTVEERPAFLERLAAARARPLPPAW